MLAADNKLVEPTISSNTDEILDTSNKCDKSDLGDSVNGTDKRKCEDGDESNSQGPKRKKWDKKNRGQNKV